MARTDDELLRCMVEISGNTATRWGGEKISDRSPLFAALDWWLSLEDLDDPGNLAILDGRTRAGGPNDYEAAAQTIRDRAISMSSVFSKVRPDVAYVAFVHPCIDAGQTKGVVRLDDIFWLGLVDEETTLKSDREPETYWTVWSLTHYIQASPETMAELESAESLRGHGKLRQGRPSGSSV